jgi:hypothetical protein
MVTVSTDDLPDAVKRLAGRAVDVGWSTWATRASVGDVDTVAVRFAHEGYRAYGVWTLGATSKGKPSAKWRAGASRSGKFFANLGDLRAYLGVAK